MRWIMGAGGLVLATWLCGAHLAAGEISGDAARGQRLFASLSCASCHGERGAGGAQAPPLRHLIGGPSVMAAAMWSHATGMWEAMRAAGIERPALTAQGAADIHAFLTGGVSREEPGDVTRGRAVFEAKLCVACHEPGTYASVELPRPAEGHSAFALIASLWEHGNGMLARMVATDRQWQSLSAEETRDLIAYLNRWK